MTNNELTSSKVAWCRAGCACGSQRGSASRAQMRAYAVAVAVALTGSSVCVHCHTKVDIHHGEVDRTTAGCYRPGYVVMTCNACNNALGNSDVIDRAAYAAAVLRASLTVPVPTLAQATAAYKVKAPISDTLKRSPFHK